MPPVSSQFEKNQKSFFITINQHNFLFHICSQKNKAKSKSPGKDIEVAQNSGLLDAYTDFGPSTPVVKDDSRPVTKKNKNQRKRENAEKMRQLSESENRADTNVEVIDSWEDLEAPVDDETNVPRSIEFPVKEKIETPVLNSIKSKAS